jgi:hypothetical protein
MTSLSVTNTHELDAKYPPFGTSWRAAKIVVQGARERMFCPVTRIRTPCSRLLACRPVDLICRIAGIGHSDTYAAFGMLIRVSVRATASLARSATSLSRILKEARSPNICLHQGLYETGG